MNLIDEYDGTLLVTSPDFPELTTFGAVRAAPLAHAVGAFAEANRMGIHARMDVPAPTPTEGVRSIQILDTTKNRVVLFRRGNLR